VLAVPDAPSPMSRALLAYDGSPKANEALFVATYLAGSWQLPLWVIVVAESGLDAAKVVTHAREYIGQRAVAATFLEAEGPAAEAILDAAEAHDCDLLLMGGYGQGLVAEVVLGSTVDQVLRASRWPLLICR
jgi:nucleotide-binding universal stress UspA family protein